MAGKGVAWVSGWVLSRAAGSPGLPHLTPPALFARAPRCPPRRAGPSWGGWWGHAAVMRCRSWNSRLIVCSPGPQRLPPLAHGTWPRGAESVPGAGGVTSAPAGAPGLGPTSRCLHLPARSPRRWVAGSEAGARRSGLWKSPLVLRHSLDPGRRWQPAPWLAAAAWAGWVPTLGRGALLRPALAAATPWARVPGWGEAAMLGPG